MTSDWKYSRSGVVINEENRRTQRETSANVTLSTTSPKWTGQGAQLGLRSENLPTNHVTYGTACSVAIQDVLQMGNQQETTSSSTTDASDRATQISMLVSSLC
jgi:hypothetical protein